MKEENKLIIANWKMNPGSKKEAISLFKDISNNLKNLKKILIIVCPPYPFLYIKEKLKIKSKKIKLGSQDVFYEKSGSYTGQISTQILKDFDLEYVIVGHSENRILGETNIIVNKKLINIIKSEMRPIFCIGEKKRDSDGFYLSYLKEQIEEGLKGLQKVHLKNIIIAYEPIWAIGSNAKRDTTVSEFIEIRIFIKKIISNMYDIKSANRVKIIYGGSVHKKNAVSFLKEGSADGLLIGRDSLNSKKFSAITNLISKSI